MSLLETSAAQEVVAADNFAFVDRLWRDWSPGHDLAAHAANAKRCLRNPEHLAAAIAYYRGRRPPASPCAAHRPNPLRDAVYFGDHQQVRPIAVLAVWTTALFTGWLVVGQRRPSAA